MVDDWFYYVNGDVRMKSIFGFNFKNNIKDIWENLNLEKF